MVSRTPFLYMVHINGVFITAPGHTVTTPVRRINDFTLATAAFLYCVSTALRNFVLIRLALKSRSL
jgi:hypothetical protein